MSVWVCGYGCALVCECVRASLAWPDSFHCFKLPENVCGGTPAFFLLAASVCQFNIAIHMLHYVTGSSNASAYYKDRTCVVQHEQRVHVCHKKKMTGYMTVVCILNTYHEMRCCVIGKVTSKQASEG